MKSNQRMRRTATSYAWGHKQAVVESQPVAEATVSRDPHEEGFDFGPQRACAQRQQALSAPAPYKNQVHSAPALYR
jgi:hypothetical protein